MLLFRWNRQALSIPDSLGRLPLSVAQSRGHVRLARCLEELQRQEAAAELPLALSPPSSSPDTGEGCPPSLQGEALVGKGGVARALLPSPTPPRRTEQRLLTLGAVGWYFLRHVSLLQRPRWQSSPRPCAALRDGYGRDHAKPALLRCP